MFERSSPPSSPLLLALAALVSSCGGSNQALEPRFVAVHNAMSAMGLAQTGAISTGSLPEGAVARIDVQLRAGECYTFLGLGSSSVDDLDVRVVGEGDLEVGRDVTHDRQAAAQVCPDRAGDYQVVVTMTEGHGGYLVTSWSGAPRGSFPATGGGGPRVASGGSGTCGAPLELAFGQPITGDTTNQGRQMQGPCAQGNAPEQVYRLTVEQRSQVTIAMSSSYDGALYLLRECGQVGSMVDCNDDAGDTEHSRLDVTLDPGTYYLVVDGYGDAAGAYEIVATTSPLQSVAQICGGATALGVGQSVRDSTQGQVDYFQATCAGGARSPDRVYALDVPQRSRMRIRQQSNHDGVLYVRTQCDDATTEIACNDDFVDTQRSLITSVVDPGRYFVYTDGYSSGGQPNTGDYTLTAELASPNGGTATADTCGAAGSITSGQTFTIDTFEAADDTQGSCGGQGGADVVYALDIRGRSQVEVKVREAEFAGAMYLQRTCGDASTESACTAIPGAAGGQNETTMSATLTPGRYHLIFDGARPDTFGSAQVEVSVRDLQALERACRSAPILRPGRTVNGSTTSETDDFQATCAGNAQSNDALYRIRLTRRSRVRIDMSSDYDGALHLRRDCLDPSTEVACNDDEGDNRHARIETTLDRGTYFLVVDGFRTGSQGSYSVELDVSRP